MSINYILLHDEDDEEVNISDIEAQSLLQSEEQSDSSSVDENNYEFINQLSNFPEDMIVNLHDFELKIIQGINQFLSWMESPLGITIINQSTQRPFSDSNNQNLQINHETITTSQLLNLSSRLKISNSFKNIIIYILIIISKTIFKLKSEFICLFMLMAVFFKINLDLTTKLTVGNRNSLFIIIFYIFSTLGINIFLFDIYPNFYYYKNNDSAWNIILAIVINDYQVKLLLVGIKTILACLPSSLIIFKMETCYQWIEVTSQFYRSTLPIYAWMYYLWKCEDKSYNLLNGGSTISLIVSILLPISYAIAKMFELSWRGKIMINSFIEMLQTMKWGVQSSRKELLLKSKGSSCPICYTHTYTPVVTSCNHVFCQACLSHWLDKKKSCPLCRVKIFNNFKYNNGLTTSFIQFF